MFPSTSSRETSGLSGKQNCFPRDYTLSVYCTGSPDNKRSYRSQGPMKMAFWSRYTITPSTMFCFMIIYTFINIAFTKKKKLPTEYSDS